MIAAVGNRTICGNLEPKTKIQKTKQKKNKKQNFKILNYKFCIRLKFVSGSLRSPLLRTLKSYFLYVTIFFEFCFRNPKLISCMLKYVLNFVLETLKSYSLYVKICFVLGTLESYSLYVKIFLEFYFRNHKKLLFIC